MRFFKMIEQKKELLKELIYLTKNKQVYNTLTETNKKAFKYLEERFFVKWDKLNLTFKQQNTIFFMIGDFVENRQYDMYESEVIDFSIKAMGECQKMKLTNQKQNNIEREKRAIEEEINNPNDDLAYIRGMGF